MARDFAKSFYSSKQWQDCREAYLKTVGYKCEDCQAKGIETPAVIVHHIVEIRPQNINDPAVTLNFANLKAVCRQCHADEHINHSNGKRYFFGENGEVIMKKASPLQKNEDALT